MQKWHIKITLECIETNNKAIFEVNKNDKTASFNLDDYDPTTASDSLILWEAFIWIIDMLGMRNLFLQEMKNILEWK